MKPLNTEEKSQIAILSAQGMTPHAIGKMMKRSENTIAKALKNPVVAANKAISAGVFLDKSRLIRGQSTQNTAVLMASAVIDADVERSRRWADIRAKKAAGEDVGALVAEMDK